MINDGKYFAFAFGLALACFTSSAHAAPPAFSDTFPWQRTPTMCQTHIAGLFTRTGMTGTGRFDDEVVRFMAENYALIVANGLEPGKPDQCTEVRGVNERPHTNAPAPPVCRASTQPAAQPNASSAFRSLKLIGTVSFVIQMSLNGIFL